MTVRQIPDWNQEDSIELRGEVIFQVLRNLAGGNYFARDCSSGWPYGISIY